MAETILIVDDDELLRETLAKVLGRELGYESRHAGNGRQALDMLAKCSGGAAFRLVLLDLNMPEMDGMETLRNITERYPGLPVVMLTGNHEIKDAVDALKAGAADFLTKPCQPDRLVVTVRNALRLSLLSQEVTRLRRTAVSALTFNDIIGHKDGLQEVVAMGRKAALSAIPVLITGETGTGKELFARAIHGESARAGKAFIAVNCGAIPANLIESTLFGHEKGAFTGATGNAPGKFREASGGTIFLDEVGELPSEAQLRLLRVLQQKEVEPVGASRTIPVDVRVISATNRDLEKDVRDKRFREDLYYRLNVLRLELPPLRNRLQDLPALISHFIERAAAAENKPITDMSPAAEQLLSSWQLPGNVRELENVIHRATVLTTNSVLQVEDFPLEFMRRADADTVPASSSTLQGSISLYSAGGQLKTVEQIEKEVVDFAFLHFEGNVTRAAEALGIAKSTFYRKKS
jgi:DNA-binding NtrC family response regulator